MATASSREELAEVDRRVMEFFEKKNKKYMDDLSHERIYELLRKACVVAKLAKAPASLDRPRKDLRMKIKEHMGAAIEWIVAMDNIDRGY